MKHFYSIRSLLLILLIIINVLTGSASACTESEEYGLNSDIHTSKPDFPLNQYLTGKLGIIDPNFGGSYLLVAYRYLNHQPLSQGEQADLMDFWRWYFLSYYSYSPRLLVSRDMFSLLVHYVMQDSILIDASVKKISPPPSIASVQQRVTEEFKDYIAWRDARLRALKQVSAVPPLKLDPTKTVEYAIFETNEYYINLAREEDQLNLNSLFLNDGMNILRFATLRLQRLMECTQDPIVLSTWVKIQQAFFRDVSMSGPDKAFDNFNQAIASFPVKLSQQMQAEKNYFQAAANFYSNNPKLILQSVDQFAALASNKNYPWREWASYISYRARALAAFKNKEVRLKNNPPKDGDAFSYSDDEKKWLTQARNSMEGLVKHANDDEVKSAARQYSNLIIARLEPNALAAFFNEASKKITFDNLKNYIYWRSLFAHQNYSYQSSLEKTLQPLPSNLENIIRLNSSNPTASDWMSLYEISANANYKRENLFNFAYRLWYTSLNNQAWLLVATNSLQYATDEQRKFIIKNINGIRVSEAGYLTLRAALLQQDDRFHFWDSYTRQQFIDRTLDSITGDDDFRSRVFFLAERAELTMNIEDLVNHSIFIPSDRLLTLYPIKTGQPPLFFIAAYNNVLQQLPLSTLSKVAALKNLPDHFRTRLVASIWVRAILLNNSKIENAMASEISKRIPDIVPYVHLRNASHDPDERQMQFLSALLHLPFLTPEVDLPLANTWRVDLSMFEGLAFIPVIKEEVLEGHANYWWRAGVLFHREGGGYNSMYSIKKDDTESYSSRFTVTIHPASFLTDPEKIEFAREYHQLEQLPNGIEWIVNQLVPLAKRHPNDQRYAELLALAVKGTHYAPCSRKSDASRRAFVTLKKLYPNSLWAKQTKFYY